MGKKDDSEYDFHFHEQRKHSTAETVALAILLVLLFVGLCVLVWQIGGGILGSGEKETLETTEISEGNKETEWAEVFGEAASSESSDDSGTMEGSEEGIPEASPENETAGEASENEESGQNSSEGSGSESQDSPGDTSQALADSDEEASENNEAGSSSEGQESGQAAASSSDSSMTFTTVDETVTAKSATNLRSEPSTMSTDTVVAVLESGMQAQRTGINEDTGWSRLIYDGQELYAVTSLLTTDLSGQTTGEVAADPDRVTTADGRVIIFSACDDTVSPKMSTNLRTEPSTSQGEATVYYELQYGETVHRTGYDADAGWSRVEYDGQILYAVTSYLYVVE
ncbi:MAG: SH3 domain-containing protein [Lachnospiraceae bacterium]|nr:SH3 domain-containing protein [Lachnospiraceae bacterium]